MKIFLSFSHTFMAHKSLQTTFFTHSRDSDYEYVLECRVLFPSSTLILKDFKIFSDIYDFVMCARTRKLLIDPCWFHQTKAFLSLRKWKHISGTKTYKRKSFEKGRSKHKYAKIKWSELKGKIKDMIRRV